jgi:hypothetical protein
MFWHFYRLYKGLKPLGAHVGEQIGIQIPAGLRGLNPARRGKFLLLLISREALRPPTKWGETDQENKGLKPLDAYVGAG